MTGKRALDLVLYILIALAIGFGAMIYAFTSPSERDVQLAVKLVSLMAGTGIVFGLYVRKGIRYRSARFWPTTLGLIAAHFTIFVAVLYHWPDLKLIWLFLLMWAESEALSRIMPNSGRQP